MYRYSKKRVCSFSLNVFYFRNHFDPATKGTSRHDGKPRPLTLRISSVRRETSTESGERIASERTYALRDRLRDAAPRCLISASGASEALGSTRPIGEPGTSDDSAHCESPVALFLVTADHTVRTRTFTERHLVRRPGSVRSPISLDLARFFRNARVDFRFCHVLSLISKSAASASRRRGGGKKKKTRETSVRTGGAIDDFTVDRPVSIDLRPDASHTAWLLKTCKTRRKENGAGRTNLSDRAARTSRDEEREKGRTWVPATLPRRVSVRSGRARFREDRSRTACTLSFIVVVRRPADLRFERALKFEIPFARNEMRDADRRRRRV